MVCSCCCCVTFISEFEPCRRTRSDKSKESLDLGRQDRGDCDVDIDNTSGLDSGLDERSYSEFKKIMKRQI